MTVEQAIEKLKIQFNTEPRRYEKSDYKALIAVLEQLNVSNYMEDNSICRLDKNYQNLYELVKDIIDHYNELHEIAIKWEDE